MYLAVVICSDPDCSEELEVEAATLDELHTYVCGCGYAMDLVGWPDWVDDGSLIAAIPEPRPDLLEAA
jgi:hypothetical protein